LWKCQYCGSLNGMYYQDSQLKGMLCLEADCGRFSDLLDEKEEISESDL